MINLLTFDVEEWFQANYPSVGREAKRKGSFLSPTASFIEEDSGLEANLERILELCAKHRAGATFFVLGRTAERYPWLIRRIARAGYEIASHGYEHKLIYNLTPDAFRMDLQKSLTILERLSGEKVLGYRAPSWSVFRSMGWFFEELKKSGLIYDSSLFPARTFLYGEKDAPRFPHSLGGLIEIPASTLEWKRVRVPFSSGFFFRAFPVAFIQRGIRALHRERQPAMLCLHPREIDPKTPRPAGWNWRDRFLHSFGTGRADRKLELLLEKFSFTSISDYLRRQNPQLFPHATPRVHTL